MFRGFPLHKCPLIGLDMAAGQSPDVTLERRWVDQLSKMLSAALAIKNGTRPANTVVYELLVDQLGVAATKGKSVEALIEEMRAAISDAHAIFEGNPMSYIPRSHIQLFSSEGVMRYTDRPADVLAGIFFPRSLLGHAGQPWEGIESLRSFMALRAWIFALQWLPERRNLAIGKDRIRAVTSAYECELFVPNVDGRTNELRFVYDPDNGFTFVRIALPDETENVTSIWLSHRTIKVGKRLVEVYFAPRLKGLISSGRRFHTRGDVADHLACTILFKSEEDWQLCAPLVRRIVLRKSEPKVIDGRRIKHASNPNTSGYEGVHWSGYVYLAKCKSELECSSLRLYMNRTASLLLDNHDAYSVRRLLRRQNPNTPSFMQYWYPESLYVPIGLGLQIGMIRRQLSMVIVDFFDHDNARAQAHVNRLCELLLQHPEGIDDPYLIPGLSVR